MIDAFLLMVSAGSAVLAVLWIVYCINQAVDDRMMLLICGFPGSDDWILNTRTYSAVPLWQHFAYLLVGMDPARLYDRARERIRQEMAVDMSRHPMRNT